MKRTRLVPTFGGCARRPGRGVAVLLALAGLGAALPRASAEDDGPARFHDVGGWRGTLVATAKPSERAQQLLGLTLRDKGVGWSLDYSLYVSVEFLLDEYESDPSVWRGRVVRTEYETAYRFTAKTTGGDQEAVFTSTGPLDFRDDDRVELQFHRMKGWSVRMDSGRRPAELHERWTSPEGKTFRNDFSGHTYGMGGTKTHPYPKNGLVLLASDETQLSSFKGVSAQWGVTPEVEWNYTVYLEPTSLDELRLEIDEPAAYKSWRPETTPDCSAGPPLEVTARLKTAKGGVPKTRVERFEWELIQTSREPGVAMNYPVDAMDKRADLELDATGEMFALSDENQKMVRAVREGFTDTVKVVPYDFGGWSTLQVTAFLADGRQVKGKLKGQPDFGLRMPKRAPDSHIADIWKDEHKGGADNLDDEKVAGQDADGDGYALYEEYRGWICDRVHLGGDPEKKDFFVLNLIGGDAQLGIDLFESVSQLRVHSRLRRSEMSQENRRMNFNRARGGHVVTQHGVWIKTFPSKSELGDGGAQTVMEKKGTAGRPGLVKGIGILPRGHADSEFSKPFNLPAEQQSSAYDRAIAHELLHSVGVEHHGTGDSRLIFGYVSTKNPQNKLGRAYYGPSQDTAVDLRTEDGQDVAVRDEPEYLKFRAMMEIALGDRLRAEAPKWLSINTGGAVLGITTAEGYVDWQIEMLAIFSFLRKEGTLGVEHGEESGDQDCLMRYYFAQFCEGKFAPFGGASKAYYLVEPGTEPIGMEICRSGAGTGVNAAGRTPQPRYGDAAAGEGNCFSNICPNDAIAPRPTK